ncbi:MAG: stage III sporulation AC/AD family protein [Oscillospiraceae bacterium]|nr:stage III sporulation AC/AD family protein [Oscillospiraceae bacterium]
MNIVSFVALILITGIITVILRKYTAEYAMLFLIGSCIFFLVIIISNVSKVLNEINFMFGMAKFPEGSQAIILKTLGICLLTQFAADFCRDCGETALSNKVEIAGKSAAILSALPLFKSIIEIAANFFGK